MTRPLALTMLMVACAASAAHARELAREPASPVAITGSWVLNAALSDDPQAALNEFDRKMRRDSPRERTPVEAPPLTGEAGRDESSLPSIPSDTSSTEGEDPPPPPRRMNDAEAELLLLIGTPQALTLSAADGTLRLDAEDRRREFRQGVASVVSFGRGVAERNAGWKGAAFVVELRAVDGPRVDERFSLDESQRLVWTTEARGSGYPRISVKRVYDRNEVVP